MTGGKMNESYPPSMGDLLPGMGTATGERPPGARLYWGVRAEESRWLRDRSIKHISKYRQTITQWNKLAHDTHSCNYNYHSCNYNYHSSSIDYHGDTSIASQITHNALGGGGAAIITNNGWPPKRTVCNVIRLATLVYGGIYNFSSHKI